MSTPLSHRRALLLMICAATLWSIAGVFTRHLDEVRGFEITFWRSLFTALFVGLTLVFQQRSNFVSNVCKVGRIGILSAFMWGIMYSAFMMALTMTTVANTLVVDSIAPFLTVIFAWLFLGQRTPLRTWLAISLASVGILWMFAGSMAEFGTTHLAGMAVALIVPIAAASNFVIFKKAGQSADLIPTVMLGALVSICLTLPLALPLQASLHDIGIMALLGVFQLGLPCMLLVRAAQTLSAPEISLLAMLEIVLGPLWAWMGAGEVPSTATLIGGAFVLVALALNELAMLRQVRRLGR
ncbi:MAG: family transporter [Burkholderiaceae bacterium]|nr:family transporter [Burkholderiaceae bacterium]